MHYGKMVRKTLVALDFDQTITNRGTISKIGELVENPETIHSLQSTLKEKGWTAYLKMALRYMHQRHIPISKIRTQLLDNVELTNGMPDLFAYLRSNSTKYDVILISDNYSCFTDWILSKYGYENLFHKIFTNPSKINSECSVTLGEYSSTSTCAICPQNMCKGMILQEFAGLGPLQNANGRKYSAVAYIGDGLGDLCPAKTLRHEDVLFARDGFELAQLATDSPEVLARIKVWGSAMEIVTSLKQMSSKHPCYQY